MKRLFLTLPLLALPTAALAETQLERLEALSEQGSEVMMEMMIREITAEGADPAPLQAAIPDMTWDDAFRDAGRCMLDAYTAELGSDGVDEMLDSLEAMYADLDDARLEDLEDLDPTGGKLSEEVQVRVTRECGFMELSMARMEESGFMAAMMQAAMSAEN
ncbi:MAG: hypothetical protein ACU0CI_01175 [Shimia sp.]